MTPSGQIHRPRPASLLALLGGALLSLAVHAAGPVGLPPASTLLLDQNAAALWPPPLPAVRRDACAGPLKAGAGGRTMDVGPGKPFTELEDVPWLQLGPGDVVNIHWRPQPYRSKIALRAQGRPEAPVIINGVTNAKCERPEISGESAVTARDAARARFFSKEHSEFLGTVFLYRGPQDKWGHRPKHLMIQNLKITGAHKKNSYTAQDGSTGRYASGAAGIYAIVAEHLTIDNCEITGNGNGIFINSRSVDEASAYITVRRSRIHGNGNSGSWLEHNLYVQAARTLYEGNYIGQLVPGALGSSLKDRASGTVVRYNHIVAAARALDLVEIEDGVKQVSDDPLYHQAWVFGNLIVSDWNNPGQSSVKLIHWGGDNSPDAFRHGTLHFYGNTVLLNVEQQKQFWYVTLFDMPEARQTVSARGNVIVNRNTAELRLGTDNGTIELAGTNWISSGWLVGDRKSPVALRRNGYLVLGRDPGLDADARPREGSPVIDKATALPPPASGPVAVENLAVRYEYSPQGGYVERQRRGKGYDLGAFEQR
ncbi:right-handed parallel beta-helix repeat-containing protein [Eleftheria terrae]|uniref:right-handed parallel beta-helix repeat-containing protein n=1 Tax=Eleftheria terrae TaxID=1597781 RepID=UPI00263B1267|nr:right-handed parallel beta-helix repeat-containing protein [Eleftheria terrae]WKB53904.1 right-handed parallel beta-helix repeat-containing protein [Eleftheria terrae]